MAEPLYQNDLDLGPLKTETIAIIGYGNHGRAHALNLRDMGAERVLIALREGSPSRAKAEADGFDVVSMTEAARRADMRVFGYDPIGAIGHHPHARLTRFADYDNLPALIDAA